MQTAETAPTPSDAWGMQSAGAEPEGFITIKQAAGRTGFSEKHILRSLQAGELSGLKLGDAYRVLHADIERAIAKAKAGDGLVVIGKSTARPLARTEGAA